MFFRLRARSLRDALPRYLSKSAVKKLYLASVFVRTFVHSVCPKSYLLRSFFSDAAAKYLKISAITAKVFFSGPATKRGGGKYFFFRLDREKIQKILHLFLCVRLSIRFKSKFLPLAAILGMRWQDIRG